MKPTHKNVNTIDSITQAADLELLADIELFHFAFRAFTAGPDEILAQMGLGRVHHRILYFVARTPGLSVSDLLNTLGVTKQALNAPLRQLIASDLINSLPDDSDARVRRLSLSAPGRTLEQRLSQTQCASLAQAFASSGSRAQAGWRAIMGELATKARPV